MRVCNGQRLGMTDLVSHDKEAATNPEGADDACDPGQGVSRAAIPSRESISGAKSANS